MAENVLGTGVDVHRDDVVTWARNVIPAYLATAVAILCVTAAARATSLWLLILAGALVAVAMIVLDATLRTQRRFQGVVAIALRLAVGVGQLVVGLVLVLWVKGDAWTFLGITALVLVGSTVLSEVRYSVRGKHARGPVALGIAVLLLGLGLWPIAAISPLAGVALAGFAIPAAVLGGELLTEDWLRSLPRWTPQQMHWIGGVLVALGAGWLLRTGSALFYVVVLFAILCALVAAVSSDGDSGEIIVLLVVALVWATAPRGADPVAAIQPQPNEPFFVAMGDSYISGEGAERFFTGTNDKQGNECRRAPTAYPVRLAQDGGPDIPDRVLFLACSGALAVDLYGTREGRTEPRSQLEQYRDALDGGLSEDDLEFVLLSVGGNDAGFGEVGQACVGPGDCSEIGQRWNNRLEDVRARLDFAYGKIDDEFDVPVYVVPYPLPLTEHPCWWSWLDDDEHQFLSGFVHELDNVVESTARAHHFNVVGTIESTFATEDLRICDRSVPGDLGMNFLAANPTSGSLGDIVNPKNWIHNSFHPNPTGHDALFRAVREWITAPRTDVPEEAIEEPRADACSVEVPPDHCTQLTSDWQMIQVRSLLRGAIWPLLLAIAGSWFIVVPKLRRATEEGTNLSKRVLAVLGRLRAWVLRYLRTTPTRS